MVPELGLSQTLSGHTGQVWDVAWNPQGNILASCGEDKTIRIWSKEAEKWACRAILADGHQRTIRSVAWSPCGSMLASASFDATCCIWDKKSGEWECTATLEGHENEVKSVAWSPSGQFLATCSRDKSVWVWEVDEDGEFECAAVLNAHTQDVKRVIWHPTLDIIASASYDNTIKLFKQDDDDWICFDTLSGHESTVWSLAFNADGSELASCSDDRSLKIWKETSGSKNAKQDLTYRCIASLTGFHTRAVYDVDWSPLTDFIATSSGDDAIRIFSRSNENPENFDLVLHVSRAHDQDVNAVAWNPTLESILASTSDDGTVKIWHFKP